MSVATLRAKPCIVRPPFRRTPMAQILRGFGPVGVDPHARVLGEPAGVDAEGGERVDDDLLDVADVAGGVELVGDGEDRIADELAGPVVRDVAAAADGDELGADVGGFAAQVVVEVRARPVREHVRVLEQQQMLLVRPREQRLLDRQRLAVGHASPATEPAADVTPTPYRRGER